MDSPADFTGPVNLGNPGEFTIRELAELVVRWSSPDRSSSSVRCRPTIRGNGGPTSRWPGLALAGRRQSRLSED